MRQLQPLQTCLHRPCGMQAWFSRGGRLVHFTRVHLCETLLALLRVCTHRVLRSKKARGTLLPPLSPQRFFCFHEAACPIQFLYSSVALSKPNLDVRAAARRSEILPMRRICRLAHICLLIWLLIPAGARPVLISEVPGPGRGLHSEDAQPLLSKLQRHYLPQFPDSPRCIDGGFLGQVAAAMPEQLCACSSGTMAVPMLPAGQRYAFYMHQAPDSTSWVLFLQGRRFCKVGAHEGLGMLRSSVLEGGS